MRRKGGGEEMSGGEEEGEGRGRTDLEFFNVFVDLVEGFDFFEVNTLGEEGEKGRRKKEEKG